MDFSHVSVLLKETVGNLITDPNGIYVDGTLGGAGHSYEICSRLSEQGRGMQAFRKRPAYWDRSGCGRNCSSDQEAGAFQR